MAEFHGINDIGGLQSIAHNARNNISYIQSDVNSIKTGLEELAAILKSNELSAVARNLDNMADGYSKIPEAFNAYPSLVDQVIVRYQAQDRAMKEQFDHLTLNMSNAEADFKYKYR